MADDTEELLKRIVALELTLMTLWDMFTHAPRGGADTDDPEGSRYIQISDTMAADVIRKLDGLLNSDLIAAVDLRSDPTDEEYSH